LAAAGFGIFTGVLGKILGAQVLTDVGTFVAAIDTTFGGFRERADQTYRLLQRPDTRFLVVAAPEPDALREASYFVERLNAENMPLGGLIVNRVQEVDRSLMSAEAATAAAERLSDVDSLTSRLLMLHAGRLRERERQHHVTERFIGAHPGVPIAEVPALAEDVHDLEGLREIGDLLARGQLV
jgi:anion-transporting  ArsA/GET3 family ATPase